MTTEHEATRTLVKSPPELWAECSDAASLARHLGEFGEIKITRLEPETAVAWEGERVSGTVRIEPSAWGTRVTLTAQTASLESYEPVADEVAEEVVAAPVEEVAEEVVAPVEEVAEEVVAAPVEEVAEPARDAVGDAVEENVVVEEARVVEEPVANEASVAEVVVAPGRKLGLMARLRAYIRRALAVDVGTIPEPPGLEASRAPQPVAVAPVVAERDERTPEPEAPAPEAESQPEAASGEPDAELGEPEAASEEPEPTLKAPEPALQEPESSGAPPQPDPGAVLTAALDSLGQAHHRPYSRA